MLVSLLKTLDPLFLFYTMLLLIISIILYYSINIYNIKIKQSNLNNKPSNISSKFKIINSNNSNNLNIHIASYNILAFNYTRADWFSYCDAKYLTPKYRAPTIIKEIKDLNADIVCFQEMDYNLFYDYYNIKLKELNYCNYLIKNNNNKLVTEVISFNKSKFNVVEQTYLDLNKNLQNYGSTFVKNKTALLLVLSFKKNPNKKILICNSHLFWNPEYEYVKYGQICSIISHINNYYSDLPLLIGGDFNSLPWSNVLKYIYRIKPTINNNNKGDFNNNKYYMEKFYKKLNHNLSLRSSYDNYKGFVVNSHLISETNINEFNEKSLSLSPQERDVLFNALADEHPEYTNYTKDFLGCLDYIIYSDDKLLLEEILEIPNDQCIKNNYLPNDVYPSDHLKISAKFSLIN